MRWRITGFREIALLAVLAGGAFGLGPAAGAEMIDGEDIEPAAMAQEPCKDRPYSVLVRVENVKKAQGTITADLHDDNPARFLKAGQHLVRVRVPAQKGETTLCMPIEKPGTYAIGLYQDVNSNRLFDKGFMGIPVEPYGISNNPPMVFGPPKLEESEFKVDGPLVPITIKLKP